MAYRIEKKLVADLESSQRAIGISFPFSEKSEKVFESTYRTIDEYRSSILNYLCTSKGERYLNPTYGNNIQELLFDNYEEKDRARLEKDLSEDLSYRFPKLTIDSINLMGESETGSIYITVKFHITGTSQSEEININFG